MFLPHTLINTRRVNKAHRGRGMETWRESNVHCEGQLRGSLYRTKVGVYAVCGWETCSTRRPSKCLLLFYLLFIRKTLSKHLPFFYLYPNYPLEATVCQLLLAQPTQSLWPSCRALSSIPKKQCKSFFFLSQISISIGFSFGVRCISLCLGMFLIMSNVSYEAKGMLTGQFFQNDPDVLTYLHILYAH